MTDQQNLVDRITGESTRRSVLKSGALATAGVGLGAAGIGGSAGQIDDEGDDAVDAQNWMKGIMPVGQFRPTARFVITSPVLEWQPNVEEIQDNVWSEYNTRVIRYWNSNEQILFWQAQDAQVPEFNQEAGYVVDAEGDVGPNDTPQPEIFRMRAEYAPFGTSGYVTVNFTPVGEEEEQTLLDEDDWWYTEDEDAVGIGEDVIETETEVEDTTPPGTETPTNATANTTNNGG